MKSLYGIAWHYLAIYFYIKLASFHVPLSDFPLSCQQLREALAADSLFFIDTKI